MSRLPQLQSTIHAMNHLLDEMGIPVQNFDQHLLYTENIRRIKDMLLELYTNPMYIEARCKNNIDAKEIEASITNIERRTSATHTDLRTWKALEPADKRKPCPSLHTSSQVTTP